MIRSLLLAAGRGRRLRPLTDTVPKPALPMLDLPLGAFGLSLLARVGPTIVNVAHLVEAVLAALEPYGNFEVLDERPEALGSAGTVGALLERMDRHFVTMNSDVITELSPEGLFDEHCGEGDPATIAVQEVPSGADFEIEGRRVTRFIDRRDEPNAPGYRFLGVAAFARDALAELDIVPPAGLGESVLRPLAERGVLRAHVHRGYWADVGTFESYLNTSVDLLTTNASLLPTSLPGALREIDGGRAYVGAGAEVEERSLGPGAIVLAGASVDATARLERSIVLPGERVSDRSLRDAVFPLWPVEG